MHIFAKKSLGQNFLKSKGAVRSIIAAAALTPDDTVLEIGPGKGFLTESLLEKSDKVIVVEKDDRMIPFLKEKFFLYEQNKALTIIHNDILISPIESLGVKEQQYKLIANIPYYITGQIIRKFLSEGPQPSCMVLMLQKEVAERIVARDGKESILSISVKVYGTPKYIEKVPAKYFSPEPNVDSAILAINTISNNFFTEKSPEKFFEILKKGFAHKRKVIVQNLEISQEKRELFFSAVGIDKNTRAETITLSQWEKIYNFLA